ncbi:MAG: hypothetical protein ACKVT2_03260 [Saprospiraceae bacterium]
MTIKHFTLSILIISLTWVGCKKDEGSDPGTPTPTPLQIIPGVGTTEIKIGDAAQVAIDNLGVPFPSNGSANGIYYHFLIYISKGVTVYCEPTTEATFNANMKISKLILSAPYDGKTDKGIGIGSTKTEVKAAYGDPISSSAIFGDEYAIGITFIYDNDIVETIEVE